MCARLSPVLFSNFMTNIAHIDNQTVTQYKVDICVKVTENTSEEATKVFEVSRRLSHKIYKYFKDQSKEDIKINTSKNRFYYNFKRDHALAVLTAFFPLLLTHNIMSLWKT